MTSAAVVTRVACQSLMIRWQPADRSEVTGPGTAISRRPRSRACRAVLTAPLRSPASTTSVPVARAAITRLRTRNLSLVTVRPGRPLADDHALGGDRFEQLGMADRVGHVDPARQYRDRHPVGPERAPVGRGVDAERAAGDHRPAAGRDRRGELGGHVGAVGGGRPRADHRDRLQAAEPQVSRAAQPQRVGLLVAEVGQLLRPFLVARADEPDTRLAEGDHLVRRRQLVQPHPPALQRALQRPLDERRYGEIAARDGQSAQFDRLEGLASPREPDQPVERLVGRLGEVGQRRPRVGLLVERAVGAAAAFTATPPATVRWPG